MAVFLSVGRVVYHFSLVIYLRPVLGANMLLDLGNRQVLEIYYQVLMSFTWSSNRLSHIATSVLLIKVLISSTLYSGVCDLTEKLQDALFPFFL